MTSYICTTDDPDGTFAKENAEKRAKEKKEAEEKKAEEKLAEKNRQSGVQSKRNRKKADNPYLRPGHKQGNLRWN